MSFIEDVNKFMELIRELDLDYKSQSDEIINAVDELIDKSFTFKMEKEDISKKVAFIGGDASQRRIECGPWFIRCLRSVVVVQNVENLEEHSGFDLYLPHTSFGKSKNITAVDERVKAICNQVKGIESYVDLNSDGSYLRDSTARSFIEFAAAANFLNQNKDNAFCYLFDGAIPSNNFKFYKESNHKSYDYYMNKETIFAGVYKSGRLLEDALWWYKHSNQDKQLVKIKEDQWRAFNKYLPFISEVEFKLFDFYISFYGSGEILPCLIQVFKNDFYLSAHGESYGNPYVKDTFLTYLKNDAKSTPMLCIPAVINSAHNGSFFHNVEIELLKKKFRDEYLKENQDELIKLYKYEFAKKHQFKTRAIKRKKVTGVGDGYRKKTG